MGYTHESLATNTLTNMECTLCTTRCGLESQPAAYIYGKHILCEKCLKNTDPDWYQTILAASQEARAFRNRQKLAERSMKDMASSRILAYGRNKDTDLQ